MLKAQQVAGLHHPLIIVGYDRGVIFLRCKVCGELFTESTRDAVEHVDEEHADG